MDKLDALVDLSYNNLDPGMIHIRWYAVGSFSLNENLSSQIGFVDILCNEKDNYHILDNESRKWRKVFQSTMDTELYAFIKAFDAAYHMAEDLKRTNGLRYELFMYTDSLQLFNSLTKEKPTYERRLMIDITAAKNHTKDQSY